LGMNWRKSSFSATDGDCVEVAFDSNSACVRDSKAPDGPELDFPGISWLAFLADCVI